MRCVSEAHSPMLPPRMNTRKLVICWKNDELASTISIMHTKTPRNRKNIVPRLFAIARMSKGRNDLRPDRNHA